MSEKREFSTIKYNDRYGYAIAYYNEFKHMKDPALEIMERSKKYALPAKKRTRVWKEVKHILENPETPKDFIHRKNIELQIEVLQDKCQKAKESFKRLHDLNENRQKVLWPEYKNTIEGKKIDAIFETVADCYEKSLEEVKKEQEVSEKPEVGTKSQSVVKDRHTNCQNLIEKRRSEALQDVDKYYESLSAINERIRKLNKAFNEDDDWICFVQLKLWVFLSLFLEIVADRKKKKNHCQGELKFIKARKYPHFRKRVPSSSIVIIIRISSIFSLSRSLQNGKVQRAEDSSVSES